MRAQYPLHSVVANWRKTYKSDKGIFGSLPGFIHKIYQEMCDETAKLRCGAVRALAPIVDLHEASRIPIDEFYSCFVVGELQECMGIIQMNPPSAYFMAKGSRLWKLEAMSKLELMKEASDNGIGGKQPRLQLGTLSEPKKRTSSTSSWPSSKRRHSESVLAANLESECAANIVIQRMSAKIVAADKEPSASRVSTVGVGAKSNAEAEPTCLVDDVVGALRLYQTFVKDEVAACDDDRSMNNIVTLEEGAHQRVEFGLVVAGP